MGLRNKGVSWQQSAGHFGSFLSNFERNGNWKNDCLLD